MDKKVKIILCLIIVVSIAGCIFYIIHNKKENSINEKITISFNTDGGSTVDIIEFKKGETITLPTTVKDGYSFLGWYYKDVLFTDKDTSSIESNIILNAKWEQIETEKNDNENLTVVFDSNGGNTINTMTFKCINGSATLTSLPIPVKNNTEFITWEDKFGTPILNEALILCDGELKLYAVWDE